MNQILLSSERLNLNKVLSTGYFDVFELIKQHQSLSCLQLETEIPNLTLSLHWKELSTPETPHSFKDLAGKKLSDYKFQYLGNFQYQDQVIPALSESFRSDFTEQTIHDCSVETTGWFNCTWLVDFLMNAPSIDKDPLRKEKLFWRQENDSFCLSLSSEAIDYRHAEQQKFSFQLDYSSVSWQHLTLFA